MKRSLTDYIALYFKGIAMGAADIVPGVSGGTIAFISGIYQELIFTINQINLEAFRILKSDGIRSFWKHINGNFTLTLLLGILTSILSVSKGVRWLLENEPIGLWSFFFGLMLASILFLTKDVTKWNFKTVFSLLTFCLLAYYITIIPRITTENSLVFLFFAGALAICAMILPGISGAFILVLLGAYHPILKAIEQKNLSIISVVGMGAIFGILTFSKLLKWLFSHYKNITIASLIGFIIGSLNKIWPWKLKEKSVLPTSFEGNPEILKAIFCLIIGFLILFLLEKWAIILKKQ